ncbi:hypothetical protein KTS45_05915 [Halomicroarcula limicola]|uniref:Uncharacterized protein n=1 Tax=Haloarcula limicola TaxID=1429915 RepID=A0A8J7Y9H8_9EURY|nr:hypothetical protein [Halomicroarcula limicola]
MTVAENTGSETQSETGASRDRMKRALREVRREGWKAAIVYAVVDATLLFLVVNLALSVLSPPSVPSQVAVPSAVLDPVGDALGRSLTGAALPVAALVGIVVGAVAFVAEVWLRVRRPLIERFEAANPPVAEALRTARDAVAADADSRMAARLYEDVLDRLRESSGVALVDLRRVAGTLVVVVLLSVATLQVAAVDLALLGGGPADPAAGGPANQSRNYTGLEDADAVLGERENVSAGDDNLTAQVESTGGDQPVEQSEQFPSSGPSGGGDGSGIDSQQAGFAGSEEIEDAALIREYNLRIREEEEDDQ